jgi:hypothetical protein
MPQPGGRHGGQVLGFACFGHRPESSVTRLLACPDDGKPVRMPRIYVRILLSK